MYIYIYVYIYIHVIHTYIHTYNIYTYLNIYIYIYIFTYVYIHIYIYGNVDHIGLFACHTWVIVLSLYIYIYNIYTMHVTAKTSQGMGSPNRISYGGFLRLGVPQYLDGLFHGKPPFIWNPW